MFCCPRETGTQSCLGEQWRKLVHGVMISNLCGSKEPSEMPISSGWEVSRMAR